MHVTNLWNSLPDTVVAAPSLNICKNRLDKHWTNQDVLYVLHAEISGTGSIPGK